ncbi:unnamed protein product [Miscanthus lutarioriparius]|uniref:Uncharacterized protein n=1 Tax=Miscanthus lutarioriparius TaxID=422564 RepID=A0A811NAB4_9POAL|nr:unnamed protein product [Miscanthus lutarioriparius]
MALDARHGRVLLSHYSPTSRRESEEDLVVCDTVKGDLLTLPWLYHWCRNDWTATLVCAVAGCDHLDYARGPFRVVFLGIDKAWPFVMSVCLYSSEVGAWSEYCGFSLLTTIAAWHPTNLGPCALVWNPLFFRCCTGILEPDLDTQDSNVR